MPGEGCRMPDAGCRMPSVAPGCFFFWLGEADTFGRVLSTPSHRWLRTLVLLVLLILLASTQSIINHQSLLLF